MAGNRLMSISQDERERAVFRSRRMYQTDLQSDLATAEDRGKAAGRLERSIEVARNALQMLKFLKMLWMLILPFIVSPMKNWRPYAPLSAKVNVVYYITVYLAFVLFNQ